MDVPFTILLYYTMKYLHTNSAFLFINQIKFWISPYSRRSFRRTFDFFKRNVKYDIMCFNVLTVFFCFCKIALYINNKSIKLIYKATV